KSAEPHVPLAGSAEAATRRADDVGVAQQRVEELPAADISGRLYPDVRCVHAAVNLEPLLREPFADELRVLKIKRDELACLLFAGIRIHGLGAALDDVTHPVELRRVAAHPKAIQVHLRLVTRAPLERFWTHGERA